MARLPISEITDNDIGSFEDAEVVANYLFQHYHFEFPVEVSNGWESVWGPYNSGALSREVFLDIGEENTLMVRFHVRFHNGKLLTYGAD